MSPQSRAQVNSESTLLIPVYLNQRMVFDLVAMLQGGISTVTRVSETSHERSSDERNVAAAVGLSNAFASLLRIDLSSTGKQKTDDEAAHKSEEERVHTPASLFFALRNLLADKGLLCHDGPEAPLPGTFIEFSTSLSRNPVIEVIDALQQIMRMAVVFAEPEQQSGSRHSKSPKASKVSPQMAQLDQIDEVREMLRTGETTDLTTGPLENGHRAVVTLETQYLNDPSMGDVVDGTFTVLGKVTRLVTAEGGAVSLIRKTALGRLPLPVLASAFGSLNALSTAQGFALPEIEWEISAPVMQVLPIAIYT